MGTTNTRLKVFELTRGKYSTNEKELLGIVWAAESFKYYLYGTASSILTDS